ncbi:hypothetical protein DMENIID0001_039000 [Sergentomyia squamirostris]
MDNCAPIIDCDFVQFTYRIYEFFYFISGTITIFARANGECAISKVASLKFVMKKPKRWEQGYIDVFLEELQVKQTTEDDSLGWWGLKEMRILYGWDSMSSLHSCLGVVSSSVLSSFPSHTCFRALFVACSCVAFKVAELKMLLWDV